MERSGKVIIFDSEEEAKIWERAIRESMNAIEVQNAKALYDSQIKNNEV